MPLAGKIKYLDIPYITATVTAQHNNVLRPQLEDIEATDAWRVLLPKGLLLNYRLKAAKLADYRKEVKC